MTRPTPPISCGSLRLSALALLIGMNAICGIQAPLQAQIAADSMNLTYQLKEKWLEAGGGQGGEMTLLVEQADGAAVARHQSNGNLAMVSNPAAGVISAAPTRGLPFLMELLEIPEGLGPGSEIPIGNGWTQVIESIEFQLERGDADLSLEGHQTEHRILTIDLRLRQVGPDGTSNRESGTGRVDLWTAPDLPFSWLPYTSPNSYLWAFPLSFNYRQITAHVLAQVSEELSGLGLLLRANVEGSIAIAEMGSEQVYRREITVEDLQTGTEPPDLTPLDQPVLTMGSYKALMGAMMLAGKSCTQGAPEGGSTLTLKSDELHEISAEGSAWTASELDMEGVSALVVGSLSRAGGSCAVVLTEPAGPQPGEYALHAGASTDEWATIPPPKATAYFLRGTEASSQLTLIDAGTLRIEAAEDGQLQGDLHGSGWTADLTPESPAMIENVAFDLSFAVDAPAAEPVPAAEPASIPAATTAWTPVAFDPSASEPIAEWDFDGKGAKWGTVDARGRYAAVALSSEPRIVLLDLDNRSELGAIEVKLDSGGNHVSALALEPSGDRLAIGLPMGTVRIVDTATRETLQEVQFTEDGSSFTPVSPLAFDGVGDRILGFTSNHIVVWNASSGEELSTWDVGMLFDVEVTSDGMRAATLNPSESLKIWDIATATEICALPGQFSRLAIHPDGSRVATWSRDNQAVIASTTDCSTLSTWPADLGFVPELAWAADGEHLILGSVEGPLLVYVASSGELAATWTGQGQVPFIYSSPLANRVFSTGLGEGSKAILWGSE